MIAKDFLPIFRAVGAPVQKEFRSWFSRLFKKQELALALLDLLRKRHETDKKQMPDDATIHLKIFNRPLLSQTDSKCLSNLYADLWHAFQDYLLWREIRQPSFERDLVWLRLLDQFHQEKEAGKHLARCAKTAENTPAKDELQFYKRLVFSQLTYFNPRLNKLDPHLASLDAAEKHLHDFHQVLHYKFQCEQLSRSNILKLKEARHAQPPESDEWLPRIYRLLFDFNRQPSAATYQSLKADFFQHHASLSDKDVVTLMTYLLNYAIRTMRQGSPKNLQDAFHLYDWGDEQGIFNKFESMDTNFFNNAVVVGCKLNELDWTEQFIKNYKPHLPEADQKKSGLIAEADLLFAKGAFLEILALFGDEPEKNERPKSPANPATRQKREPAGSKNQALAAPAKPDEPAAEAEKPHFTDPVAILRVKSLCLRSHYELRTGEVLDHCKALDFYLARTKKLRGDVIEAASNFVAFVKKLEHDSDAPDDLKNEILATVHLFHADWLLKKCSEKSARSRKSRRFSKPTLT